MAAPARIALYPGTFDPLTRGHLDIIARGAAVFETLIVALGDNPDKTALLSADERAAIITRSTGDWANVRVETYTGLTVDAARRVGAGVILRGLRGAGDFHAEFEAAETNRTVAGIETVVLISSADCAFISSSLVRQIAAGGGDVSSLVPPASEAALRKHFTGS
ncbi:MAG: pantetheine-phosphate adenylyltransferase [Phycisphaerae bacterium]|nr:pantetheine-phosphate adenylyltransferase [Phycisphaerae bacterium]